MSLWSVTTGHNLGTYQEKVPTTINLPVVGSPFTMLIAGTLPAGTRLTNNTITGTFFEVPRNTEYKFVLRATTSLPDPIIEDRTFTVNVQGPDAPVWITPEGTLKIGANDQLFILDSSYISYQLSVTDSDLSAGDTLKYYIPSDGGNLPPGVTLSDSGKLTGIIDPILALDIQSGTGFYDSNNYASYPFDFGSVGAYPSSSYYFDIQQNYAFFNENNKIRSARKLNRYYEFKVNATDGDTIQSRTFQIFVVGDDFLRADNTIMQVGSGVFTSDGTYLREPQWLTPADLGFKRANNYVTIFLELYDPNTVPGTVSYILESKNDDGSLSTLPTGMSIDALTGEITGRVPYQPAITKEYKFTVSATRYDLQSSLVAVSINPYEDQMQGTANLKVAKLPLGTADGISDLEELKNQEIVVNDNNYKILGYDDDNDKYDVLQLDKSLIGTDLKVFTGAVYQASTFKTNPTLINRAANEIFIYNRADKNRYIGKILKFSATEEYKIENVQTVLNEGEPADQGITNATAIDKLILNVNLTRSFVDSENISVGAFKGATTFKQFIVTPSQSVVTLPKATKTFTVKILGEVDSTISWKTDTDLGSINASYTSTFKIEATSTVPDAKMKYFLTDGTLPPGLTLTINGEIIGKVNQYGDGTIAGLTFFENGLTFDGELTSIDRKFTFTVTARDRYGFSAVPKTFSISVKVQGTTLYSNLYVQPLLNLTSRDSFRTFISDPNIFDPQYIYRETDPTFGVQKKLKMLMYAGIEQKSIAHYVSATASNHKRKKYKLGDVKIAEAKYEGTNTVAYEVVYVDVVDPQDNKGTKVAKSFKMANTQKFKVNQTQIEVTDDTTKLNVGGSTYTIFLQNNSQVSTQAIGEDLQIYAREGRLFLDLTAGTLTVTLVDGSTVANVGSVVYNKADPFRFRPKGGVIKVDTSILKTDSSDENRFIANTTNMRDNIAGIGTSAPGFLPLWMRTAQTGTVQHLGFVTAIPLCYCTPGSGTTIALAIKNSGFDFKTIDFEIDRYIIDSTTGVAQEQYVLFPDYQYNI